MYSVYSALYYSKIQLLSIPNYDTINNKFEKFKCEYNNVFDNYSDELKSENFYSTWRAKFKRNEKGEIIPDKRALEYFEKNPERIEENIETLKKFIDAELLRIKTINDAEEELISSKNAKLIDCAQKLESSKGKGYVKTIIEVVQILILLKDTVDLGEATLNMIKKFREFLL